MSVGDFKDAGKAVNKINAHKNDIKVKNNAVKNGRAKNNLAPSKEAVGDHSTFKRDKNGNITNTATYKKNPKNPSGFQEVKRVDRVGKSHGGISTPHVHENGKVRPARIDEI